LTFGQSLKVCGRSPGQRVGDEERRLMHLVPAPAVRLMKRRVQSRPGVRQENRFLSERTLLSGVFNDVGDLQKEENRFLTEGQSLTAGLHWIGHIFYYLLLSYPNLQTQSFGRLIIINKRRPKMSSNRRLGRLG